MSANYYSHPAEVGKPCPRCGAWEDEKDTLSCGERQSGRRIVNLTPHAVAIHGDEGFIVAIQASGNVARCEEERTPERPILAGGHLAGMYIPVSRATYGAVTGLPASDGATVYIVSALVLAQCAGRTDVFAPGPAIRDAAGKVIGCHGMSAAPLPVWDVDRDRNCIHGVDLSDECRECIESRLAALADERRRLSQQLASSAS